LLKRNSSHWAETKCGTDIQTLLKLNAQDTYRRWYKNDQHCSNLVTKTLPKWKQTIYFVCPFWEVVIKLMNSLGKWYITSCNSFSVNTRGKTFILSGTSNITNSGNARAAVVDLMINKHTRSTTCIIVNKCIFIVLT
jgi:hypothetical protein